LVAINFLRFLLKTPLLSDFFYRAKNLPRSNRGETSIVKAELEITA